MPHRVKINETKLTDELNLLWWYRTERPACYLIQREIIIDLMKSAGSVNIYVCLTGPVALKILFPHLRAVRTDYDTFVCENVRFLVHTLVNSYRGYKPLFLDDDLAVVEFKRRQIRIYKGAQKHRLFEHKVPSPDNECEITTLIMGGDLLSYPYWLLRDFFYPAFHLFETRVLVARCLRLTLKFVHKLFMLLGLRDLASKLQFKKLSVDEFLGLSLDSMSPLHQLVRKESYDLVTDNGENTLFGEILSHFKSDANKAKSIKKLFYKKQELLRDLPLHFDPMYWGATNGHYLIPILVGFRTGVMPYESYKSKNTSHMPRLEDYLRLDEMREEEITQALAAPYPEVLGKHVLSGRHRMLAMVGHLLRGNVYLPVTVKRF